jgi:hypothetical protein
MQCLPGRFAGNHPWLPEGYCRVAGAWFDKPDGRAQALNPSLKILHRKVEMVEEIPSEGKNKDWRARVNRLIVKRFTETGGVHENEEL